MNKVMAFALAAVACGCVTVNKNDGGTDKRAPLVAKDIVHEKFKVGESTVAASDKVNCLFNFICWGSTANHNADAVPFDFGGVAKAKNGAYANACDSAKCDQIVGAKYKVTTEDYFVFKRINAEISGYPATLTGVELIENKQPCGEK